MAEAMETEGPADKYKAGRQGGRQAGKEAGRKAGRRVGRQAGNGMHAFGSAAVRGCLCWLLGMVQAQRRARHSH